MKAHAITVRAIAGMLMLPGLCAPPAGAVDDILRPEEAFRYTVSAGDDEILVRWQIEPEHYLYKERMAYSSRTDGLVLGDAIMPDGKPYEDEFFGRMEIYRGHADIRLPIVERAPGLQTAELELRSQGCADIGLCYPPQVWTATVTLPADEPAAGVRIESLLRGQPAAGARDDPLPPEVAFQPRAEILDPFSVLVTWQIADGYYLYRDSLKVSSDSDTARPGPPVLSPGTPKWDEHFGDTTVYYGEATMSVPLTRSSPDPADFRLFLDYQGCKEDSICYPPQRTELLVSLPVATAADRPRPEDGAEPMVSEQDRLSALIVEGNLALVLLTFTGLGLLLAFTPCVLPMVPILSGIIAGQGKDVTTARAFTLSLIYVLGMALTYTLAGAAVAAAGGQIQATLQQPWIIILVAALFVALALAMFGLYELQLPAAIQSRLTAAGNRQRTGTFFGTAMLGALSALVVTTCVAPPLVASLTVIAKAGDVTRGALSLFALSIGMGIPLLIIGTSAGRLLPRAGAWMEAVKEFFGFLMLGLAIWMLDRILPGTVTMVLWAALAVMAGVWLGAFERLESPAGHRARLGKGAGILATLYGAALLIGALSGSQDPFQPLRLTGGAAVTHEGIEFRRIKTVADLEREIAGAVAAGQPVMLDFYADWCVSCKEMERYTFTDERVRAALAGAVLLQADVTANDAEDRALLQHFDIFGPPTIMFFTRDGRERPAYRVVGYMPADEFAAHAQSAFSAVTTI